MAFSAFLSRAYEYYARHGFAATLSRTKLAFQRLFANRMIVFYCDLGKQIGSDGIPGSLRVQRLRTYAELSSEDLQELTGFWNPGQAHRNIRERFGKGASLWLIRSGDGLAAFSWTLRGRTVAEYYFPLGQDDVQLFDFYVFPKFRGRAILWFLITYILQSLKEEGVLRVFGDVAEWNRASLSFYKTIPFQQLGVVRTLRIFGRTVVCWTPDAVRDRKPVKQALVDATISDQPSITNTRVKTRVKTVNSILLAFLRSMKQCFSALTAVVS